MEVRPPRIPTLDGWRTIAIGLVVWHHVMMGFFTSETAYYGVSLSHMGAFGVDVFFAISGLLITLLLLEEHQLHGAVSVGGFYIRRAFRILPPCFVYLGAAAIVAGLATRWDLLSSVFFFRNYLPQELGSQVTGHLWSLAVEEHFYLLWPALFLSVGVVYKARGVAWMALLCGLWRVADAQNHWTDAWLGSVPSHFRTDLRLDALLWGCVVAFLLHDQRTREKLARGLRPVWFWPMVTAVVVGIVFYSHLTALWLAMLLPLLPASTLLHPEWAVSRWLEHPAMRFTGRMSYSLYLWQQLFLTAGWEHPRVFQQAPWNLLLVFACAFASYRFVERPCMNLGRRLSERWRGASIAPQESSAPARDQACSTLQ